MNATLHWPALKQLTPILIVEQIEPCLRFWIDRLGFTATIEVPDPDGRLAFAAVEKDGIEIMYQCRAALPVEDAEAAEASSGVSAVLYLTVENLDVIELAVAAAPVVKSRHRTLYGSSEIYVREPGGHRVGFAQLECVAAAGSSPQVDSPLPVAASD